MEFKGVREDCFCYDNRRKQCLGLNKLYCRVENCSFYRTCKENEKAKRKVYEYYKQKNIDNQFDV